MYVDNFGDMNCENFTTGDKGVLKLTQRGWGDKGAYEVNGSIKNKDGVEKWRMKGRWDNEIRLINVQTGKELVYNIFFFQADSNNNYSKIYS